MSSKDKVATWRASLSKEERDKQREKDRERKAKKWLEMTEEEKIESREKQRLRKANVKKSLDDKKKQEEKEAREIEEIEKWQMRIDYNHLVNWQNAFDRIQAKYWNQQPLPYDPVSLFFEKKWEQDKNYQIRRRSKQTEAEREFERIQNLLIKRASRASRTVEQIKDDNTKAREGMEFEKILPFKTRRRYKCRDEYLWWRYWNNGDEFKALLREKLPNYASKFTEWDSKNENFYAEVDAVDEGIDIDDNKERTPEQLRQLRNERLKQRRIKIREQLNQPIEIEEFEKSEYELIRERIIAERERMMKEAEERGDFDMK